MSGKRKTLLQRWRQHTLGNQVVVITGILVTFSSIVYTLTTMYQAHLFRQNAEETGKQTDRMVAASERMAETSAAQVNAMQGQLNAMQEQANALKESLAETRKAANAATTQAAASQTQANASVAQAEVAKQALGATQSSARATEQASEIAARSFALTQQPNVQLVDATMSALEVAKNPALTAYIQNTGVAPINNVLSESKVQLSPTLPPLNFPIWDDKLIQGDPGAFIPAGGKKYFHNSFQNWALTQQGLDAVKSGRTKLYILGEIRYRDGLGRRWHYRYCGEYVPAEDRLLSCGESNSLQEQQN